MGWRDELIHVIRPNIERDRDDGIYIDYEGIAADLYSMPPADRIALARELLAGTGRVVARDVPGSVICDPWWMGWDACRQAMLPKDDTP